MNNVSVCRWTSGSIPLDTDGDLSCDTPGIPTMSPTTAYADGSDSAPVDLALCRRPRTVTTAMTSSHGPTDSDVANDGLDTDADVCLRCRRRGRPDNDSIDDGSRRLHQRWYRPSTRTSDGDTCDDCSVVQPPDD